MSAPKTMRVVLEVDVSLMTAAELREAQAGFTRQSWAENDVQEIADVLSCEGHEMWAEFFAGSGLFVKFDEVRVDAAEWIA